MLTLNLGPLALSLSHALLLGSLLLASLTGWWLGRRSARNPEGVLFLLLLVALLVARIAFVARYFDEYQQSPWQMLDVRDGGFLIWPGLLAALLVAAALAWRDRLLRKPLLGALAVGVLVWGGGQLVLRSLEQGTRLPELALRDMDGQPVALHDYLGKPLVINLWATWCPPCVVEMPELVFFHEKYKDKGAMVLGVNYEKNDVAKIHNFAQELMINFPIVRFKDIDLNKNSTPFGPLRGLPSTYMVAPNGEVVAGRAGIVDLKLLEAFIAKYENQ